MWSDEARRRPLCLPGQQRHGLPGWSIPGPQLAVPAAWRTESPESQEEAGLAVQPAPLQPQALPSQRLKGCFNIAASADLRWLFTRDWRTQQRTAVFFSFKFVLPNRKHFTLCWPICLYVSVSWLFD